VELYRILDSGFRSKEAEERLRRGNCEWMVNYELLCSFLAVLATHCLPPSPFERSWKLAGLPARMAGRDKMSSRSTKQETIATLKNERTTQVCH